MLITGSSGFLGSRLALYLRERYDLLLPTHSELNVSREEAVMAYFQEHQPQFVLHCAALCNTALCQQHPEDSHRVNVQGTVKLAKACKHFGAKFIFFSSEQVYNGTPLTGPLGEWDAQQPVTIYGQHKLEAEQRALRNNPDTVALRLSWLYDLPSSTLKPSTNILSNLQQAHDQGTTIQVATHECRGITYVWDVVRNIQAALRLPGGSYNFGCGNTLNSHALHLEAARLMGLPDPASWILPDEDRYAHQPRNLSMNCALVESYGIRFADSLESLAQALHHPFRY